MKHDLFPLLNREFIDNNPEEGHNKSFYRFLLAFDKIKSKN